MKLAYITTDEERYLKPLLERGFEIGVVITNNPKSKVVGFCNMEGIRCEVIDHRQFDNRKDHDLAIMKELDEYDLDLVLLGGYRRLIKDREFLEKYRKKMINVHNSFLPNFPGVKPHEEVFGSGIEMSGYTIHYVDEVMDRGEIIFQEEVFVGDCENAQEVYDLITERACVGVLGVVGGFDKKKTLKPYISKSD
jgi:phosphoribosylglycinamide formyltransferase 1